MSRCAGRVTLVAATLLAPATRLSARDAQTTSSPLALPAHHATLHHYTPHRATVRHATPVKPTLATNDTPVTGRDEQPPELTYDLPTAADRRLEASSRDATSARVVAASDATLASFTQGPSTAASTAPPHGPLSPALHTPTATTGRRVIWMQVTAYCACPKCCGPKANGITASGKRVDYNAGHFVAADTSVLPLGAHVSVPGYADGAPVEVIDRGSAIKGARLDVFFPTHEQAMAWGRQWLAVTVEP